MNKRKGISLIVLIITIVVIIILAAAVILTLSKNNPVESAKKATFLSDVSMYQDELIMLVGQKYIDNLGDFDVASLDGKVLEDVIEIESKYNEKFTIKNGKIVGTDKLTQQEKEWASTITGGGIGNVTPPTPPMPTIPIPTGGNVYIDSDKVEVPIPVGFTVSTVEGENTVKDGLVIKRGNDGTAKDTDVNEFVWIPVNDITEMYDNITKKGKLYDFSNGRVSVMRRDCLTTTTNYREPAYLIDTSSGDASSYNTIGITQAILQQEFNAMISSVTKFGGFYIGRYETGDLSKSKAVIRKLNTDINNQNWYTIYSKIKRIVSNSGAQTTIVWGCQWDATLRWMNKDSSIGNYVTSVAKKGNYHDQTFTYIQANGTTATKEPNKSTIIPTGGYEGAKVKNIYDMAGNINDWTMEADRTSDRAIRGGSYSSYNLSASYRYYQYPYSTGTFFGARAQLYLK